MLIDSLTKLSFSGNSKMATGTSSVISNTGAGIKFGNNSSAEDPDDYVPTWPPLVQFPPKPSK